MASVGSFPSARSGPRANPEAKPTEHPAKQPSPKHDRSVVQVTAYNRPAIQVGGLGQPCHGMLARGVRRGVRARSVR